MTRRLRALAAAVVLLASAGCSTLPDRAYFPPPGHEDTRRLAAVLHRAAQAAGDDPARYTFALIASRDVSAYTVEDATFYFSEGLARQPDRVVDALVAHEVAHEVLGHRGQRSSLALGLSAGFTVAGVLVPGVGLLDLLVSPLVVRAYTRDQEIAADLKGVELLRTMGYQSPRRALAEALRAAAAINGPPREGWLAVEPKLKTRLAALEPLEAVAEAAVTPPRR